MDLDPEPLPNLVLHPGDALAFPHDGGPNHSTVLLLDRHGHTYAVLECNTSTNRWVIDAIRFVAAGGRVLPVRSEPDADPHLEPQPRADGDGVVRTHRHAHHGTPRDVLPNGLAAERYEHTHPHTHAVRRDDRSYHDDHGH